MKDTLYLQIVFLIILSGVVFTLFKYSQEGDILTLTSNATHLNEFSSKFPTRNDVVERLHSLLIYKEGYVRWNRYLLIAMFASLVILFFTRGEVRLSEFILTTCFLFLCIDLPSRWGHSHISQGVIQEATQLYVYHRLLEK